MWRAFKSASEEGLGVGMRRQLPPPSTLISVAYSVLELIESLLNRDIQGSPGPTQIPADQISQHHDQHMAAGVVGRAHINGTSFEVSGLALAKGLLDFSRSL